MKRKAQLLAVIACPQRYIVKKHLNCSLQIFWQDDAGDVHWDYLRYSTASPFAPVGFRVNDFGDEGRCFEQYWSGKATLVKGCEWINQRKTHRDLIIAVKQEWAEHDFDASKCLIRFDAVYPIDPYHASRYGIKSLADKLDEWHRMHAKYDPHYGRITEDEFQRVVRPIIVALPVLPVTYQCVDATLHCEGRMRMMKLSLSRLLGDRIYTSRWMGMLKTLGALPPDAAQTQTGIVKSIRRAVRAGLTSTASGRKWFKKLNALSLLGGWARREETARKQTTKEEIFA